MKDPSSSVPPQTSVSVSQDQPQTPETPAHIDWNGWLETVRALPSGAPDWEDLPQFLETLEQLYTNNQQEREEWNTQRQRLQAALSDLVTGAGEMLRFFEMQDISQWTVEACTPPHIATAIQLSEQLLPLLLEHHKYNQRRAAIRAEDILRRQKVDELDTEITGIYERLAKLFALSPEQPSQQQKEERRVEADPSRTSSKLSSGTLDKPPPPPQPEEVLSQEGEPSSSEMEPESTDLRADAPEPSAVPESAPSEPMPPIPDPFSQPEPASPQDGHELGTSKEKTSERSVPPSETESPLSPQSEQPQEEGKSVSTSPEAEESSSNDPRSSDLKSEQIDQGGVSGIHHELPTVVKSDVSPLDIFLPGTENPAIQTIAIQFQAAPGRKDWTSFLWALIAGDELPTAYWLARALPAMEQPCPVPSRLLAAIQVARWLPPDSQTFVDDLREEIIQNAQPFEEEPQKLLSLSAALRTTLLAPSTEIQTWLSVPESCPSLGKIVEAIKTFARWGRSLQPADLRGVADVEQRKESLREATQKAKTWLEEASKRRTTLKRASNVWLYMTAPDGAIRTFLLPVVKNEQKKLNEVRENLKQWQDKDYIISRVNEIDRKLAGRKARKIDGAIRDRIVRDVQEACGLARRWSECIEREQEIQSGKDPFFEMTNEVRSQIQEALPEVIQALQELSSPGQPQPISAAAQCLLRSVEQLQNMFTGQTLPPTRQQEWFTRNTDSLQTALGRLLLWLPEIPQEDAGQIGEANLPQVAPALCDAIAADRSLQAAFDTWLDKQDYRFVETMLEAFDEADLPAKSRAYQEALEGSHDGLRIAMSKTRLAIDHAVVDGISTEGSSEYEGIVESMDLDETLYFSPKHEQLEQINSQLQKARRVRLQEVQTAWDQLQPQLASRLDPTELERIQTFVQANLVRQETRVVEECVAHLTEVVEESRELEKELFSPPDNRDALQEFLNAMPQLEDSFKRMSPREVGRNIKRGSSIAGIKFGETPGKRRGEAVQAIEAWRSLKQGRVNGSTISGGVTTLLRYLGFSLGSESNLSVHRGQQSTDWVYIQAQMAASDLTKPIPQFGSQTDGRYDIVCVWERPGADTMSAWLRQLGLDTRSVLVFYLGRLTVRQRHDFAQRARNQELVSAVLDETLLVFLAQERDARLPIFLRCTLPFSAANPYTPFQAGDVPPEMFFGRDQMVRELQRPSGSCLVYGGRQLGKSALLQHVRREFHHPGQEQYAWVKDIKLLGDPQAGSLPETLWEQIRDGLKELGLLPHRITTNKPGEVARHIQEMMTTHPERRVLMLFDEADNFLDADSKDRFQVVEGLRTLMLDTQRHFKVVFAGLHNVQRFQGIPNQPLAQFGTPLLVGPLEPTAAQQLVRQPLEVLGYRFENAGTILRILSYTNYHPGLIQLFCQELLKRLRERQQRTSPPYSIAQSDVERVYLLPQVRDGIRERFDLTLALDTRYQAIVWAIILNQIDKSGGYAQAYTPVDLLRLVREWWSKGFDKVDSDQLRGLLDEMRGLGVLVRDTEGYYRLRSPNLVHLVGTKTDIEDRLLTLSDKEPEEPFNADSHHALLDDQEWQYSPLTYSEERRLNPLRFGVGLVFASDATGLDHLKVAFRRFIPADLPETKGDYQEIPSAALSGTVLQQWLKRYLDEHNNCERLILSCSFQGTQVNPLETVRIARKVCQQHERSKKRWMRILFVFDPESTRNWLSLSYQQRQEVENQVDVVTFPRRWNLSGIRQRLRQQDKIDSDEVCRAVSEATGGWPLLLDVLFERCAPHDDPRPAVETIEKDLGDPHSELFQEFKRSLGLYDITYRILEFIKTEGDVEREFSVELVTPEFIDGLSQDECRTALDYLQRTGCIELQGDLLSVEPTVLRLL